MSAPPLGEMETPVSASARAVLFSFFPLFFLFLMVVNVDRWRSGQPETVANRGFRDIGVDV